MTEAQFLKIAVLEGTIHVFNKKGLKFTMDDLARELGMSKKTIYTIFHEKTELFLAMVDYLFDSIKVSEQEVLEDTTLSTLEKIKKILGVIPEGYNEIDFRQLYSLRDKFPGVYVQVEQRLETGWETTIALLEQGMREGVIRKVSIPIVKTMMEASLEQFFRRDTLIKNGLTYGEALQEVVDIIVEGIEVRKADNQEGGKQ